MGWASYIYIKTNDIDLLISKIKNYYVVGQIVVESEPNNWMFLRSDGPRTFIVNCNYSTEWTQLDFPLENRYEFDEMFRRISLELSTVVLLGYYNSIDGSFRFAVIDKGKLVRSICISSLSSGELRLIDNFGSAFPFEKIQFEVPFTRDLPVSIRLDYEDLHDWFSKLGYKGEAILKDNKYYHLEILNFRG